MKKCSQCGLEKPLDDFYANAESRDGYSSMCKQCQNKISRRYAQENRDKIREYKRQRYLRRKEIFAELKRLAEENGFSKRDN